MIKNLLIAGALATAPITISNAPLTANTIDIKYNFNGYTQAYTDIQYDTDNNIETAFYTRYKGTEKTQIKNGIGNFKQVIWKDEAIYNSEHEYTQRIYIITEYTNTANYTDLARFYLKGTINSYALQDYDFINVESNSTYNTPSNEATQLLNKNYPTSQSYNYVDEYNNLAFSYTNATQVQYMQFTTQDANILNSIFINIIPSNTQLTGTIYNYTRIIISYNDMYPKTTPFQDLTEYPTTAIMNINYYSNAVATEEIVDIPGLLFEILGMPFAFISTAFNLTIFPNTMYEINISHILMALIIAGIVIFIIKKIFK